MTRVLTHVLAGVCLAAMCAATGCGGQEGTATPTSPTVPSTTSGSAPSASPAAVAASPTTTPAPMPGPSPSPVPGPSSSGSSTSGNQTSNNDRDELNGQAAAVAGSCPAHTLTFTVNGTRVVTNAATLFKDGTCASVKNGAPVEVKGTPQSDGSLLATSVELKAGDQEPAPEPELENEVKGAIAAASIIGSCTAHTLAFRVSGVLVQTNAQTEFKNTTCAALKAGDSVEAKGDRTDAQNLKASRVERKK